MALGQVKPNTVVRLLKTGEFALIKSRSYMFDRFLNYMADIEGRHNSPGEARLI